MAKNSKNPLDEMVEDLVVFRNPNGDYFSNNPLWNDSRIREHWMATKSDEATAESDEVEEEEEAPDYESWTNDQLREELARRQLSVDGKKVDLVARLQEDDEAEPEEV